MEPYTKVVRDYFPYLNRYEYTRSDIPGQTFFSDRAQGTFDTSLYLVGEKNPAWRHQVILNQDATTQLSITKNNVSFRGGISSARSVAVQNYFGTRTFTCQLTGRLWPAIPADPVNVNIDQLVTLALERFYRDVSKKRSALLAGESLGEIRQTIRGLRRPFGKLQSAMRAYYDRVKPGRRRYRTVNDRVSFIRDSYLEAVFGWQPLFRDIESLCTLLREKDVRRVFTVKGSANSRSASISTSLEGVQDLLVSLEHEVGTRSFVKYRAGLVLDRIDPRFVPLRAAGLTLNQFLPTIYELLPYSFLVDYFTNVGSLVQAVANQQMQYAWKVFTSSVQTHSRITLTNALPNFVDPYTTYTHLSYVPGTTRLTSKLIRRSRVPEIPLPRFRIRIPMSGKPWVNMIALTSSFKKLRFPEATPASHSRLGG